MSLNLVKGQKVKVNENNPGLPIGVGLGWDVGSNAFDLDAYVIAVDGEKSILNGDASFICYFNSPDLTDATKAAEHGPKAVEFFQSAKAKDYHPKQIFNGAVIHYGDNRSGEGEGDDEVLTVKVNDIPASVTKLVFGVVIFEATPSQNFGQVKNGFIRIFNTTTGEELLKYDLSEDYSVFQGVNIGELYRHDGQWKFAALSAGYSGTLENAIPLACN